MLLKINPDNPQQRKISIVVDCLHNGGVIIYPTDTVYAIGCNAFSGKAFDKLSRIKGKKKGNYNFSFICADLRHISDFTLSLATPTFKLLKKALPGPFTFILNANNRIARQFNKKKKTVGVRIPDNEIVLSIIQHLGKPLLSTSLHDEDEIVDYMTDPDVIHNEYNKQVDIIIHGGNGGNKPSTVIDCTGSEPKIIREGKGRFADIAY